MSVSINGTGGLTFSDSSVQSTAATGFGFKNRIINGDMRIDQRNAGVSVATTTATSFTYTLDRWAYYVSVASKFTVQRTPSTTETGYATRVGAGFTNYLAITSTSSYTSGASEIFLLSQCIEGFNFADMAWGTASAKTVTLSFLVYSSIAGTHSGAISNINGSQTYPFTFTVASANTWTQVSITIPGSTSGTWPTDNSQGLYLFFNTGTGSSKLGTANAWTGTVCYGVTGSVSIVGTSGATLYITGVQLEKGSTATSFDYRPYGTELALCQRYYQSAPDSTFAGTGGQYVSGLFPVTMRTAPTLTIVGTSGSAASVTANGFYYTNASNFDLGYTASAEL